MQDGVKFIFKTLLTVPIIIFVSFAVFNLFGFALTYFKLLGISYVVMQTAVENNYIPPAELATIEDYLADITNTAVVDNAEIVLQDDAGVNPVATVRRQYGQAVTVGVRAHYRIMMPLMPKEQSLGYVMGNENSGQTVAGMSGGASMEFADAAELENRRRINEENPNNNIVIMYTVPGLQYYPDMN